MRKEQASTQQSGVVKGIVQQSRYAVQALAGEVVGGGHPSPTVFALAIRPVELHCCDAAVSVLCSISFLAFVPVCRSLLVSRYAHPAYPHPPADHQE